MFLLGQEEGKQHRGFLRWTRRGSRRSSEPAKATVDMEPVIQTEKDARRLSSARRSAKQDQPAPASSKELRDVPQAQEAAHRSPGVELSTFVTAAEHAREGEELQSFNSAHPDSEVRRPAPLRSRRPCFYPWRGSHTRGIRSRYFEQLHRDVRC